MTKYLFTRSANVVQLSSLGPVLFLLWLNAGCGRSTTVTGPEGEQTTVTQKDNGVEVAVKGEHGEEARLVAGEGVALPEDFPKDVAIYPKATVIMSMTIDKGKQVTLKTADSAQKIEAFYKERLKQDGWEIKGSMNMPQLMMLNGVKDDRTLTISISTESGETMINLVVTGKK